ncbi:MAG: CCA tRNA nucleotidyltransferase [archaeon]|jgi:tRNA nucleotidyltransferase (CCA-adding enzyme)
MNPLYKKVLKKITPTKKEVLAEQKLVSQIREKLKKLEGKHSHLEWCGSSARGTHLRGDRDLDLFIMFHKELPAQQLEEEGLRLAKTIFQGHKWEKAYSQHPYIRGEIKGFEVEIVPSYIVASGAEKQSAVDRTPFHNKYLLEKLTDTQKAEARLLKQFLKGINAYGADLKNCSLPGYGAELFIVTFKTFENTIKALAKMRPGEVIDFGTGIERAQKLFEKEHYPLIIIDPVDSNRNVASALSAEQFERMILAANLFLKKPNIKFFFPKKSKTWPKKKIQKMLTKKELIAISANFPQTVLSDLVWGQLRRYLKKVETHLRENDFEVTQSGLWSDEKKVIFLFELTSLNLQQAKKVIGPMANDIENTKRFLEKKRITISGPRVEGERIVIEIQREETSAHKLLERFTKKCLIDEKEAMRLCLHKAKILSEKNILKEYKNGFAEYLTQYLEGKEAFE